MIKHMSREISFLSKGSVTRSTDKGFVSCMNSEVGIQIPWLGKCLRTTFNRAGIGLFVVVGHQMPSETDGLGEGLPTTGDITAKRLFVGVQFLVFGQVPFQSKGSPTFTDERLILWSKLLPGSWLMIRETCLS